MVTAKLLEVYFEFLPTRKTRLFSSSTMKDHPLWNEAVFLAFCDLEVTEQSYGAYSMLGAAVIAPVSAAVVAVGAEWTEQNIANRVKKWNWVMIDAVSRTMKKVVVMQLFKNLFFFFFA